MCSNFINKFKMTKILSSLFILFPLFALSQTWESVAPMPEGRHHPVTFSLDGKGYAITGTNSSESPTDDVFQFDPNNNQWNALPSFPGPDRSFAIGQAYNGKGYLGFGASNSAYLNDIWEYDPTTSSWNLLTTCDCSGRRHPAFIIREDKIYVGLGDGSSGNLDDWYIYDMISDTWTQESDIPGATRHHPFMFPAGDHVYAGMGHGAVVYNDWYKFNIQTNSWETMSDFPGESRVAGTQFGHEGKGYVLSGDGSNHGPMPTGEFWEYDPATDDWTELDPHPGISRWAPGSFVINGSVYFVGGQNRQTGAILNDMWTYQLSAPSSTTELENNQDVHIYPNPTSGILNISNQFEANSTITIRNISGQSVFQATLSSNQSTINLSNLESGAYFVSIETDSNVIQKKLIVSF
jgi:N-acetylneuraminic acid mutarotase